MHLFAPDDPRPIHFMGIAGAGMSALALIARRRGVAVTGCDLDPAGAADAVRAGAVIHEGHSSSHVAGTRAVVHTAAVPADHAELRAAREVGIPVVRRADALQKAVAGGRLIAIAGTHGKTTTAAMTTDALVAAGSDPTGLTGGRVARWGGNARLGGGDLFVVEADEYDRAFLSLDPQVAVVTNVEADHLECYGSLEVLESAFATFAGRAECVMLGADDDGAMRVARGLRGNVWKVGLAEHADARVTGVVLEVDVTRAQLALPDGRSVAFALTVPGLHNVKNAAFALAVVAWHGGDLERAANAIAEFGGVGRRFELVGEAGGITVVDDYAHHPTEVAATLAAARQRYVGGRLIAVFQPHLYSRTQALGEAAGVELARADLVVVTEIYAAREKPIPGVTGRLVADAVAAAGTEVMWVPDRGDLLQSLATLLRSGDVVITLGAGDVTRVGPELLARLRQGAPA